MVPSGPSGVFMLGRNGTQSTVFFAAGCCAAQRARRPSKPASSSQSSKEVTRWPRRIGGSKMAGHRSGTARSVMSAVGPVLGRICRSLRACRSAVSCCIRDIPRSGGRAVKSLCTQFVPGGSKRHTPDIPWRSRQVEKLRSSRTEADDRSRPNSDV